MPVKIASHILALRTECRYPKTKLPHGFCYVIKEETVKRVGLFDAVNFPHYGSEDDYSLRSCNAEYESIIMDDVFVWHMPHALLV